MILVEFIRLTIVLAFTAAGYQWGQALAEPFQLASPEGGRLIASVVGAGAGYVIGGVLGRALHAGAGAVERRVERISGAELLTGFLGVVSGILLSIAISWPIIALVPSAIVAYSSAAIVFGLVTYLVLRIAIKKRNELLQLMGLSQFRTFQYSTEHAQRGPKVLDTSAVIDGRIVDVARSGFLTGRLICPGFVLAEVQAIADSSDPTRRARGRRGLEILDALQGESHVRLEVSDISIPEAEDIDAKLVALAKRIEGILVTTDFNLHKAAELQGIPVLNVNSLAAALKPAVLPGEELFVQIVREGTQAEQGVGYLQDGTMVVVEGARDMVGREVQAIVTSSLQTAAGRMLFSVIKDAAASAR